MNTCNSKQRDRLRAAIFFFYDKQGIADRYVFTLLHGIAPELKRLLVVVNGELTKDSRKAFENYAAVYSDMRFDLLVRENEGFDVWAYKTGIELLGWTEIERYDELILFNFTIMGPVYPFEKVFEEMDKHPVDFWGLNIHYGAKEDPFGIAPYGYLPKHLQSHFISFRKTLVSSTCFHEYWENIPMIYSYQESVALHESFLTKYFYDQGFRWEAFTKTDDLQYFTPYPLMDMPVIVLRDRHCPIFKRKNFFEDNAHFALRGSVAGIGPELLRYLRDATDYDVGLIYENMLRATRPYEYAQNLDVIRVMRPMMPERTELRIAVFARIGQYGSIIDLERLKASFPEDTQWFIAGDNDGKMTAANLFTGVDADCGDFDVVFVINPPEAEHENERYTIAETVTRAVGRWFASKESVACLLNILSEKCVGMASLARPGIWTEALQSHWQRVCTEFFVNSDYHKCKLPAGSGMGIYAVKMSAMHESGADSISVGEGYRGRLYDMVLAAHMKGFLPVAVTDEIELMDYIRVQEWRNMLTKEEWKEMHNPFKNNVKFSTSEKMMIKRNRKQGQQDSERSMGYLGRRAIGRMKYLDYIFRQMVYWLKYMISKQVFRIMIMGKRFVIFLKMMKMTLKYNCERIYSRCGGSVRIWLKEVLGKERYDRVKAIKRRMIGPHDSI